MDFSSLIDLVVVLLTASAVVAAHVLIARLLHLDRVLTRLSGLVARSPDDAPSRLTRLAFPIAAVVLVAAVVTLGLIAEPIWAAFTLVFLCAGMTATAISSSRAPARVEARHHQRAHTTLKKAA